MSGHVEIIKGDRDSYILRHIPDFYSSSVGSDGLNGFMFKPKPDIVLMRETDLITQFIQSELKKFDDLNSTSTSADEPSAGSDSLGWGLQHPFIVQSVINPNGHDIYARDGAGRERLMRALAAWVDTPVGREMLFGGEEETCDGADKYKETLDLGLNTLQNHSAPDVSVSIPGAISFAGQVMVPKPGFEEMNKPWEPATVMTFSDAAMDMLDDILERGDEEAAREMYERWVQRYDFFMGYC